MFLILCRWVEVVDFRIWMTSALQKFQEIVQPFSSPRF